MKFIPTDQVYEISKEEREIADIHEGHEPEEHACGGCFSAESDVCWSKRYDEEIPNRQKRDRGKHECKCVCHHLVDQCRMALSSLENDGNVMYRLADDDGWSIVMPSTVHDMFQQMPEDVREEAMRMILADAKSRQGPGKKDGGGG